MRNSLVKEHKGLLIYKDEQLISICRRGEASPLINVEKTKTDTDRVDFRGAHNPTCYVASMFDALAILIDSLEVEI